MKTRMAVITVLVPGEGIALQTFWLDNRGEWRNMQTFSFSRLPLETIARLDSKHWIVKVRAVEPRRAE